MPTLLAEALVRDVPDFPKPGIVFKDITPILQDPAAFQEVVDRFAERATELQPDVIVGIESRGFIFAAPVALSLARPLALIRKIGKLPHSTIQEEYSLEYGTSTIEIHEDAILPGQRVLVIDDLLATGGTARAAAALVEKLGASVAGFAFLIDLTFLDGRSVLAGYEVRSFIDY